MTPSKEHAVLQTGRRSSVVIKSVGLSTTDDETPRFEIVTKRMSHFDAHEVARTLNAGEDVTGDIAKSLIVSGNSEDVKDARVGVS